VARAQGRSDSASHEPEEAPASVALLISSLVACQDDEESSRIIGELQRRGDAEALSAADRLTRSAAPRERILGARVLGQIGYRYPKIEPFAHVRREAITRLRQLLGADPDAGSYGPRSTVSVL
jgi:hypothetical protein